MSWSAREKNLTLLEALNPVFEKHGVNIQDRDSADTWIDVYSKGIATATMEIARHQPYFDNHTLGFVTSSYTPFGLSDDFMKVLQASGMPPEEANERALAFKEDFASACKTLVEAYKAPTAARGE